MQYSIEQKKEEFNKRNLISLLIEGFTFSGALSIFSIDSVIPLYLSNITKSPFAMALLTILQYGLHYGMYIFACMIGVRTKTPKKTSVIICFLQRIGFLLIFISTFFTGNSSSLIIFFIAYGFYSLSSGLSSPLFHQMVSVAIFKDIGRFYGNYSLLGAMGGVLGTVLFNYCTKQFNFPINFRYVFLFGLILGCIATIVVAVGVREITDGRITENLGIKDILRKSIDIMKNNVRFRNYVIIKAIMVCAEFALPYYVLTIVAKKDAPVWLAGLLPGIYLISKMIGSRIEGIISDKYSAYAILICCGVCGAIAASLAILSNNWILSVIMYVFVAFAMAGSWIADSVATLEYSNGQFVPIYSATQGLLNAPLYIITSIAGATIVSYFSYSAMFTIALLIYIVCIALAIKYSKNERYE